MILIVGDAAPLRMRLLELRRVIDQLSDARLDAFASGTRLPRRRAVLNDRALGSAARDLAAAIFDRDGDRVAQLLTHDPRLVAMPVGAEDDMLTVAIATSEPALVEMLLEHGAVADGHVAGRPLELAICARDPAMAYLLLRGGAAANPCGRPVAPMRAAITVNSLGAMEMLLDHGADPNAVEDGGRRPLHIALSMETFRIAELLLDRGADAWAVDDAGINLGSMLVKPMQTAASLEVAARVRLLDRLVALRWPDPPPSPARIRTLADSGKWPPIRV